MGRSTEPRRTSDWTCDQELEAAARYIAAVRTAAGPAARLRAVLSRPGLTAVVTVLRSVPVVHATFSDGATGSGLRGCFTGGRIPLLSQVPIAVLRLPTTHAEYLRGRPRQALRTNVNRATAAGITCALVTCPEELAQVIAQVAARRHQDPATMVHPGARPSATQRFIVARDAAGQPLALSETVIDGSWAGLATLVTVTDGASSPVDSQVLRYLLHAETVRDLIDQAVTHLAVSGSMLLSPAGTRYFQRRTGFEPVWLRPTTVPSSPAPAPLPTRVAALVPRPRAADDVPAAAEPVGV